MWNRSSAIGLSKASCLQCQGQGLRLIRQKTEVPCNCVFRAIFRACYNRFRECVAEGPYSNSVTLEYSGGKDGRRSYGRKKEEYIADFCLVSRNALDERRHLLFKYHFLMGAGWRLCCKKLNMERGEFFHEVYRIQQLLGRTFAELKPFPLYPVDEYFNCLVRRERVYPLPATVDPEDLDYPLSA